jgi:hypothetical protein
MLDGVSVTTSCVLALPPSSTRNGPLTEIDTGALIPEVIDWLKLVSLPQGAGSGSG